MTPPAPGKLDGTFTFSSPLGGYNGVQADLTEQPTSVVEGTSFTLTLELQFGDVLTLPTRSLDIHLSSQAPVSDGTVLPMLAPNSQSTSYAEATYAEVEDAAGTDSRSWTNTATGGVRIDKITGQTVELTLLGIELDAQPGTAMGSVLLGGSGVMTICQSDPQCYSH